MKYIDESWIKPLALGGMILSSGGGGDTENFEKILSEILINKDSIQLLEIDDMIGEDYYCSNGMMGISNVIDSYSFSGKNGVETISRMEKIEDCKISAIYPFEGAGINLLYPIITAKMMGIPIVDGDIMGRCFTDLSMTTLEINDRNISPFILKDTMDIIHIFTSTSTKSIEREVRKVLSRIDNLGFFAGGLEKGERLSKALIPGTISLAKEIGNSFKYNNYDDIVEDIREAVIKSIYGEVFHLFKGKVVSIEEANFNKDWTRFTLVGNKKTDRGIYSILAKDQFLLAYNNQKVSCTSPDIISAIDLNTLQPVTFGRLKNGMEIGVIGIEAPESHKSKKGLELMSLKAFGYKLPYKSMKELRE
ncbi:MAG: DUF917 domain-containing protein [Eubacteriales bacterium]